MRKSMRAITSLLMSSTIAMSAASITAMPSFVADKTTYKITMDTTEDHSYTAYQIFTGVLHESTSGTTTTKTLSNIKWGSGVKSAELIEALKTDGTYGDVFTAAIGSATGDATAEKVAKQLDTYADRGDDAKAIAKIIGKYITGSGKSGTQDTGITGLTAGYYLIRDTTATPPEGETLSEFMLEVVSNVNVEAKDETVTSTKTVTDVNDSTGASEEGQKNADYDIGDDVPYVLTFKLPSKYDDYAKYPITFTDTMCEGLTLNSDAKIYYGADDTTGTSIDFSSAAATGDYAGGKVYTYSIDDLKAAQEAAAAGTALKSLGAGDVITIKYTAKLNSKAKIGGAGNKNTYNVTFASDPTWTGEGENEPENPPTGQTPPDVNVVFTYKLVVNKVDEDAAALNGADFDLYKFVLDENGEDTYGGNKGTWTLVTALNSGTDKPSKTGGTSGSQFVFTGIDDGHYKLVEKTTPSGYNSIDDIEFDITPNENGDLEDVDLGEATFTADDAEGSLTGSIQNNKGVTLPGTGGIGTRIFYIAGILFLAGGSVLLICKKRMGIKEK